MNLIGLYQNHPEWTRERMYEEFNQGRSERNELPLNRDGFKRFYEEVLGLDTEEEEAEDAEAANAGVEDQEMQDDEVEESQDAVPEAAETSMSVAAFVNTWSLDENIAVAELYSNSHMMRVEKTKEFKQQLQNRSDGRDGVYQQHKRLQKIGMTPTKLRELKDMGFKRIPVRRLQMPAWMFSEELKLLQICREGVKQITKDLAEPYNKDAEKGRTRSQDALYRRWERLVDYNKSPSDELYATKIAKVEAKIAAITDPLAPDPLATDLLGNLL